jgi:tRNA (guanine37-N1)-methyltransferase
MKITILTLFPELFTGFIGTSIIKRALAAQKLTIELVNIRDYTEDKHHQVDDYPFGGGAGMLMMIEPLVKAIRAHQSDKSHVLLTGTHGQPFNQEIARELAGKQDLVIICGRYEGIDARIEHYIDQELSIGDYVLNGGELAAMVITEAVSRLVDEVISAESLLSESFNDNLLEAPQYTKPPEFEGLKVPEVLLSGHHQNIRDWQSQRALDITKEKRPDLYAKHLAETTLTGSLLDNYNNGLVASRNYNCAEKVLNLSNEVLKLDLNEQALTVAGGFGHGMGIQHLCGAVAAAVMVLSLRHVKTIGRKSEIGEIEQNFFIELSARLGTLQCDQLIERYYDSQSHCEHIIKTTIEVLDKYI